MYVIFNASFTIPCVVIQNWKMKFSKSASLQELILYVFKIKRINLLFSIK